MNDIGHLIGAISIDDPRRCPRLYSGFKSMVVGVCTARTIGLRQATTATVTTSSDAADRTVESCGATS